MMILLKAIFLLASSSALAAPKAAPSQKIDFQYTDGLFGTYRLVTTAKSVELRAGPRVVTFDIKKCNQKLVDVYLGRVRKSLGQLRVASRANPANRVVMNKKTYRVVLSSPAAPMLRNLPSETYYLSRLQADLCKKGRVPANDPAGIGQKWEQISDKLNLGAKDKGGCIDCEGNELTARTETGDLWEDCAHEICDGKSADIPDLYGETDDIAKVGIDSAAATAFDKKYGKMLDEMTVKSTELYLDSNEKYIEALGNPPGKITDMESMAFYETLAGEIHSATIMDDADPLKRSILKVPGAQEKLDWHRDFAEQLDARYEAPTPLDYVRKVAPMANDAESVKVFAKGILDGMKSVQKSGFGKKRDLAELYPSISLNLLQKAAKTGDLIPEEVDMLVTAKARADAVQVKVESKDYLEKLEALGKSVLKSRRASAGLLENAKNHLASEREALKSVANEESSGEVYKHEQCRMAYAVNVTKAPTKEQIADAKKIEMEVRSNVDQKVFSKMSKHTAAVMREKSKKWEFNYPKQAKSIEAAFDSGIGEVVTTIKKAKPSPSLGEAYQMATDISQFCTATGETNRPLYDSVETTTGAVMVSRESVKYPEVARDVMAHEMGHMIATTFEGKDVSGESSGAFRTVRQCLARKHEFEGRSKLKKFGNMSVRETELTEEDWADQVAHLANPEKTQQMWCTGFKGVADASRTISPRSDADDVHSSQLFRLMFGEYGVKGELPATCTQALKKSKLKIDFSSCM